MSTAMPKALITTPMPNARYFGHSIRVTICSPCARVREPQNSQGALQFAQVSAYRTSESRALHRDYSMLDALRGRREPELHRQSSREERVTAPVADASAVSL